MLRGQSVEVWGKKRAKVWIKVPFKIYNSFNPKQEDLLFDVLETLERWRRYRQPGSVCQTECRFDYVAISPFFAPDFRFHCHKANGSLLDAPPPFLP